ncbi:peptidylprolyl isomerase [Mesorhizobium sp. L-8-3]|uniref:peptidylprolyl isomerase n=1 Tax=Mesorhizobium sp. L-8-3 TaxID=2744522 RepID=UPI001928D7D3|nr:peptidylprolyl isomerase [Mesorhizobium sp. L-8-3]BCH21196.1 hypothetical protein MesoLjLb_09810 [Mesorhizobium sp. L-8-3]
MSLIRRLLTEPLIQFLIIGGVVVALWNWLDRTPGAKDLQVIEIGPGRIAQLYESFSRAWQRPPTQQELDGLIEAFVKEEIFYREGIGMGLDRDDTVLRRRMQQKMEFLMEPGAEELDPTDTELEAYLKDNAAAFHVPARVAFRQIFFDPAKRGDKMQYDMAGLLAVLGEGGKAPADAGDPTLLPASLPLMPIDQIARNFGDAYAEAIASSDEGRWNGPLVSTFGRHLVFVVDRADPRDPSLDDVRELVLRDWRSAKRRTLAEARYREMRANYRVTIALPEQDATSSSVSDE